MEYGDLATALQNVIYSQDSDFESFIGAINEALTQLFYCGLDKQMEELETRKHNLCVVMALRNYPEAERLTDVVVYYCADLLRKL